MGTSADHITGILGGIDWKLVRRHPRYPMDIQVRVTFVKAGEKTTPSGRGSELSVGGMAAYISNELEIGDRISIEMKLPYSQETIEVDAVIRNRSGFRYGVEFKDLTESQRQIVERACTALSLL